MPLSLVKNYIHIVFSTHHRRPLIHPSVSDQLFAYVGGTCNSLNCQSIKVGSHRDHLHVLCRLHQSIALARLIQEVKSNSSKWMKSHGGSLQNFTWQNGYGAFSINEDLVETVSRYIDRQEEHHGSNRVSYQEEFLLFLEENNVEYDAQYLWD